MALAQGDLGLLESDIAKRLLSSTVPARLAYTAKDGTPRVMPIWFHWTGDELVMCTFVPSPKIAAIRENPPVAITIDTDGFPPDSLLIRGRAAVTEVEGAAPEYAAAARLGSRGELDARDAKAAVGALEVDAGGGIDRGRRMAGALEPAGQRHREAAGVGGADQLLGVRSGSLLEARGEGVLTFERAAPEAHGSLAVSQAAFPTCGRAAFGHSVPSWFRARARP